jgi:pimeloyl-ACP methyl ester carboxylesterase
MDLLELADFLEGGMNPLPPLGVVIGHSLGGKVALELGRQGSSSLRQVWALDSDPGIQEPGHAHEINRVIAAVRRVSMPAASRAAVVTALGEQGLSSGLASWMTTNLRRVGDDYLWTFDLAAIEELLVDYFARDLWPFLEAENPALERHLVIAANSDRWNGTMRTRADDLGKHAGAHIYRLPDAGHWLHVDNPDGLLALLAPRL